jgi:hypothetical protein
MQKEVYCYIIDNGMQVLKVKQSKIQKLLENKDIAPLDIMEQVGSEDITDLIDYLLCEYNLYNRYDIQFIIDYFNDIVCDLESQELEKQDNIN